MHDNNFHLRKFENDKEKVRFKCGSKRKHFLKISKETLYNSLAQAIIKIFSTPNHSLKVILTLFVFSSTGFASYMIAKSTISYFDFEVITTSRIILETSATFPRVKFCNLSPFKTKHAFEFLKGLNSSYNILRNESLLDDLSYEESAELIDNFSTDFNSIMFESHFSQEVLQKLSHRLEDTLISCSFNYQKCSHRDFVSKVDPIMGSCFEFNSGSEVDAKKISLAGPAYGLKVCKTDLNFNCNF